LPHKLIIDIGNRINLIDDLLLLLAPLLGDKNKANLPYIVPLLSLSETDIGEFKALFLSVFILEAISLNSPTLFFLSFV
jgi:hypothetical protein